MSTPSDQLSLASIGAVGTLLRKAIQDALPVAPEQYLTIPVPGTHIDLKDAERGGAFVYDAEKHILPPTSVRQAEARLVDGMMPLSNVMTGKPGKSVARSYARALDLLVPKENATTGIDDSTSAQNPQQSYENAMKFMTRKLEGGKSVIDMYTEKERNWVKASEAVEFAKSNAEKTAEDLFPRSSGSNYMAKRTEYLRKWHQEHDYKNKAQLQSAWMDWVTNGYKFKVEYSFAVTDTDSIMQRIENSKETLRNATLLDADGANEAYGVALEPSQWATYCKDKSGNDKQWTKVDFSFSPSDQAAAASVGGLVDSDETHAKMQSEMAKCDVHVSFSAMVVDIKRPWLHGELFSDTSVQVMDGVTLSPGPQVLNKMIQTEAVTPDAAGSTFPAYPASFIVATDTAIEFQGSTKNIEEYFGSSVRSSVGWGPWSTATPPSASPDQKVQMEATAKSCKLSFTSPQIIGWVSEILPNLPK